ncbi:spore cortex-lytic enzyme [Paenibacillus albiflavus]|uniref:Spore cortex-lytic enzyme n=1 Tax=Paenibacillus albiflavus TaxID=2545760 RepID=A0A4R4EK29_9BACL|nr:spore cortex-lytic enzyme [Paenibacillus albiflavus]TCZ78741.1 spore cortex-lytic enzyme [Paenibacillus albiflavus]
MRKFLLPFLIAIITMTGVMSASMAFAAPAPTIQYGSNSGDVWDIQFRLQILGYYKQSSDGIFGYNTEQAVRKFQRDYGLSVDGIAGSKTWNALKKVSVNADELTMLAHVVHSEARGEPYTGKVAVAAVVMNRLQSPQFPNSIAEVIFQPRAFTAVDDGQYWLTPDKSAYAAAWDAVSGWDPTGDALYYFNPDTATSSWIWSRQQTGKIGKHIFAI